MPVQIEHEGETKTFYTQKELDAEVAGLKVTLGQLKAEKDDLKTKADSAAEEVRNAQEVAAKATGDKEALERISAEREQEAQASLNELKNSIKTEKINNFYNDIVTELGAGGSKNEDLRDLLKARFPADYDMTEHNIKLGGVSSIDELKKTIKESGRYDAFLAGTGSLGGHSKGQLGTGAATKKLSEMTATEEALFARENPEQYKQMITQ
jgi:uncharacterized protein YPO0396